MAAVNWRRIYRAFREVLWNLFLMGLGSVVCAAAVNGILIPQQFLSGGFLGLSLLIYYFLPVLPVGVFYILFNIPLYLFGWFFVSRRFFIYSIFGTAFFSLAMEFVQVSIPLDDKLLSSLLAGIIGGAGSGIILKSMGSAGGTDILSVILKTRFSVRLSTTILAFNLIILAAAAIFLSLEGALYTLIYLYVSSQLINVVVTGLSQRKAVFIVSAASEAIGKRIMEEVHRGLTIIQGKGGYSGAEQRVLYTVVTFSELAVLKQIIRKEDPAAFVVITETAEVMGHRIGNQPHW